MQDITLCYSGGSGGFLLLHLLLLSGKYHTVFENNRSLADVVQSQWNITNHVKWKDTETWPDNKKTHHATTSLSRLYFNCNPEIGLVKFPSKRLILYVDINSQLELSYFKKASYFYLDTSEDSVAIRKIQRFKTVLAEWNCHYDNVKDTNWPKCLSFRHIHRLPKEIQQELLANKYTQQIINQKLPFASAVFKNDLVKEDLVPILKSADMVVKLQDVINSNGQVLENLLEIPTINDKQHKLIEHWKKLHPQQLLQKIGIEF